MMEQQAIAIVSNMVFSLENTLKYREDNGDIIKVDEYMIPEALRVVLDIAKVNRVSNIVDDIIKEK